MSDQYISDFISERVLNFFSFEDFDNFTATNVESKLSIFDSMDGEVWDLAFEIGEKLRWHVIHYEHRNIHGDEHGVIEMSGTVEVKMVSKSIYTLKIKYLDIDIDAFEFIQTLFSYKVISLSDRSVFGVNDEIYDFDNMTCNNGFIDFEFVLDK